jgi:4,5-dihydroxyphthalate decarboxylase
MSNPSGANPSGRSGASPLRLTLSAIPAPLTFAIMRGEAVPEGVELTLNEAKTVDGNSRQMLNQAYDVAEMSLATFVKAREEGVPLVGLPIFTGRRFLQPGLAATKQSGIRTPEDFRGKRVAVPQMWMTSSVWHRGILDQHHGVPQEAVTWYTAVEERMEGMKPPPGVEIRRLPEGTMPADAVQRGEVDAMMSPGPVDSLLKESDQVIRPLPDLAEAERSYYEKTGVLPIMHFVVMREELEGQHPWVAESLCRAFQTSKERGLASNPPPPLIAGNTREADAEVFGPDPYPYGLARNRRALEAFLRITRDLGLIQRPLTIEDLFAPSTRGIFD